MARRKADQTATPPEAKATTSKRGSKASAEAAESQLTQELKDRYEAAGLEIKPISSENGGGYGVVKSNGKTGRSRRYQSLDICPDVETLETWINDYMATQEANAAQEAASTDSQEVIGDEAATQESESQEPTEATQAEEARIEQSIDATLAETIPLESTPADDRSLEGWADVILDNAAAQTKVEEGEAFQAIAQQPQIEAELATAPTEVEASTAPAEASTAPTEEEDIRQISALYTTAPDKYDLVGDLVSSELLPYTNAKGVRWRLIKTRAFQRQYNAYIDAEGGFQYTVFDQIHWDGGQHPDGDQVEGMGKFQIYTPLEGETPAPETAPARGRRGRRPNSANGNGGNSEKPSEPQAEVEEEVSSVEVPNSIKFLMETKATDYYKPGGLTTTLPPEWETVIQLLETGASLDQLNKAIGSEKKPLYFSQTLGRYGKGMRKEGGQYVLVDA